MPQKLISFDHDEWLEQRRSVLTATEIAKAIRSPKYAGDLREEKRTGVQRFQGNEYTDWGKLREPVIANYISRQVDDRLVTNDDLWINDDSTIGATPDMVDSRYTRGEPLRIIAEIKTVVEHLDWLDGDIPPKYYDQVQIQMHVTESDECLFAWEPYELVGDSFRVAGEIRTRLIKRDDARISELLEFAAKWRAGEAEELPDITYPLEQIAKLTEQKRALDELISELREEITYQIGDGPASYDFPGLATVTMKRASVRKTFNAAKFRKDYPDMAAQYTVEKEGKPTLSITFVKED
ncbi:YqaJ viral recombinase family protein [Corynebacterium sp. HMSC28B08]|uniref:YqaJ viral recombinase family protein n=1 Tax=Corynebacterium sp. HMSC28B08 TaxID=1581066 RepID=UPI0008A20677|nr:YqaJ viral recombinase family protein [Corynebacterium sp. HMSC28B08]OFT88988.1 hypothetical protein HMPREF3098_06745 [Corynebacterium sp. HMSC28B08]